MTTTVASMVAEARAQIENLTPDQVRDELERGATLIDLREDNERRATGVIGGSIPAPRGMLEFWADPTSPYHRPEFDPDARLILVCASGGRSALSASALQRMGFPKVAHLDGGMKAWKEQGYATEDPA